MDRQPAPGWLGSVKRVIERALTQVCGDQELLKLTSIDAGPSGTGDSGRAAAAFGNLQCDVGAPGGRAGTKSKDSLPTRRTNFAVLDLFYERLPSWLCATAKRIHRAVPHLRNGRGMREGEPSVGRYVDPGASERRECTHSIRASGLGGSAPH